MVSGLFKLAAKVVLSNPRFRKEAIKLGLKTIDKAKPQIKKYVSAFKETIKVVSPIDDPKKFRDVYNIYKTGIGESGAATAATTEAPRAGGSAGGGAAGGAGG